MRIERRRYGGDALLADFGTDRHAEALALWRRLSAAPPPWCAEAVLGDGAVLLHLKGEPGPLPEPDPNPPPPRTFEIPVRYDGEDLEEVARLAGLSRDAVVRLHAGAAYSVRFLGFQPGFPYLDGLPPELDLPRLERPRVRVPAGSVAIAAGRCGIYPRESPGGWRLIGTTPAVLFDAAKDPPALLSPGDRVRFVPE